MQVVNYMNEKSRIFTESPSEDLESMSVSLLFDQEPSPEASSDTDVGRVFV